MEDGWVGVVRGARKKRTLQKLSSIDDARGDLKGNDMALPIKNPLAFIMDTILDNWRERTCASFRSLIGIPIVLVDLPIATTTTTTHTYQPRRRDREH